MKIRVIKFMFVFAVAGSIFISCSQHQPVIVDRDFKTSANNDELVAICSRAAHENDKTLLLYILDNWEIIPQNNSVIVLDGKIEIEIVNKSGNTYNFYDPDTMEELVYIRANGINRGYRVVGKSVIYSSRQFLISRGEKLSITVDVDDSLKRGLFMVPVEYFQKWRFDPGKYTVDIYLINPSHKIEGIEMFYCPSELVKGKSDR